MTKHVARLYIATASLLGLFLAWAAIAAHPWPRSPSTSTSAQALVQYEQRLQVDAALLRQLAASRPSQTAAPQVRVVTLPALTTIRTS
jgi:hypothetical protein